jgi:hypothetical protein
MVLVTKIAWTSMSDQEPPPFVRCFLLAYGYMLPVVGIWDQEWREGPHRDGAAIRADVTHWSPAEGVRACEEQPPI